MNLLDIARAAIAKSPAETATGATRHWRVRFSKLNPMEVFFAPAATREEVAALYPGAAVEPMPEADQPEAPRAT
jgi:hypothetical protein